MFRVIGAGLAAFALSAPAPLFDATPLAAATDPTPGTANNGLPPERFRKNGAAVVIFTDRQGIADMCGVAEPPLQIIACAFRTKDGAPVIVMPNACPAGRVELYAKIMCHENGHINGWGPDHED